MRLRSCNLFVEQQEKKIVQKKTQLVDVGEGIDSGQIQSDVIECPDD